MVYAPVRLAASAHIGRFVQRGEGSRRQDDWVCFWRICHHFFAKLAETRQHSPTRSRWAWLLMAPPVVIQDSPNNHCLKSDINFNNDINIEDIIKKSDDLLDDYKFEELYVLLSQYKHVKNAQLLWRLARAYCAYAKLEGEKGHSHEHRRKELMEEGFMFAQRALELEDTNPRCHSWFATMMHYTSEFHGIKEHYLNAFTIRDHYEKAVSLDPKDAVSLHSLGYWCFEFAHLPWYQKKILSLLFRSPPKTTFEQALNYFYTAEEVAPGFFSMNLVMAGRAHFHLHQFDKARDCFTRASEVIPRSPDERQAHAKALEMLRKIDHHHH